MRSWTLLVVVALLAGACTAPATLPAGGCFSDSSCADPTPRCDRNTSACVPCLPSNDNCPAGKRCVARGASYVCAGCLVAVDCPALASGRAAACCGGQCVDVTSDAHNCGACGTSCPAPTSGAATCTDGACGASPCAGGALDCNGDPRDGCEVDGQTDVKNCGACGARCAGGPNQSAACEAGACRSTCAAGWSHCSASASDGCEVHTEVDVKNCGACGHACPAVPGATAVCRAGGCAMFSCMAPFADCDGLAANGCEVNTSDDTGNCGACGQACPAVDNGAPGCRASTCGIGQCMVGFADCDGAVKTGCEAHLDTDVANCGACGKACALANATPSCAMGACAIAACNPTFADCDGKAENGCEVATATDAQNCGACGTVCPVDKPVCAAGVCHGMFPHHDGVGDTWMDAVATGTYTVDEAMAACKAYSAEQLGGTGTCTKACNCNGNDPCVAVLTKAQSYAWFYDHGPSTGQVTENCCNCKLVGPWD